MSLQKDPFILGVGIASLVAAAGLAFMAFQAGGKLTEAQAALETNKTELSRLQGLAPYPDESNVKKLKVQLDAVSSSVTELQKSLSAMKFPLETVTPEKFQDILKNTVNDLISKKGSVSLMSKEKGKDGDFYAGFDAYKSAVPPVDAVPYLMRELKVIQWLTEKLLATRVTAIHSLGRKSKSEEKGGKDAKSADLTKPGVAPKVGDKKDKTDGIRRDVFDIEFTADQEKFRDILNSIVANKEQFLIVRNIKLQNTAEKPPERVNPNAKKAEAAAPATDTNATATPTDGVAPTAPVTPAPAPVVKVESYDTPLGNEEVNVTLTIEILDFPEPVDPAAKNAPAVKKPATGAEQKPAASTQK